MTQQDIIDLLGADRLARALRAKPAFLDHISAAIGEVERAPARPFAVLRAAIRSYQLAGLRPPTEMIGWRLAAPSAESSTAPAQLPPADAPLEGEAPHSPLHGPIAPLSL